MRNIISASAIVVFATVCGFAAAQDGRSLIDRAKENVASRNAKPKIVGGTEVDSDKYSFQVALIASSAQPGFEQFGQFCGASLIADRWVLTAAHCVDTAAPGDLDTLIGARVLPNDGTVVGARISIDAILVHDDYDPATNDNDIALLHLIQDAPAEVKRVAAATPDQHAVWGIDDADLLVIGWGRTQEGGSTTPNLMRVLVDLKNRDTCEENYQDDFPSITISDNMFCAGVEGGGRDSCQGDSGGYIGTSIGGGDYIQLGVVSWGVGCARPGLFGVYTLVANYADWIADEMANF